MDVPALAPAQKVALGGAALAIVGSVLPWITGEQGEVSGIAIDGFLTFMAGVSVLGIATLWDWRWLPMLGVTLFGVLIAAFSASTLFTIEGAAGASEAGIAAGVGTYVVLVAGILVAGSGVYGIVGARRTAAGGADVDDDDPAGSE